MTPRRLFMFYELAELRIWREQLRQFQISLVAAQGDQKAIDAMLRDLDLGG